MTSNTEPLDPKDHQADDQVQGLMQRQKRRLKRAGHSTCARARSSVRGGAVSTWGSECSFL